jgi:hypothetical protein
LFRVVVVVVVCVYRTTFWVDWSERERERQDSQERIKRQKMKEKTKRAKEKRKDKQKKNYVEQEQEHVGQPETTYARRVDIYIYIYYTSIQQ